MDDKQFSLQTLVPDKFFAAYNDQCLVLNEMQDS
jgi:hypothetical protein